MIVNIKISILGIIGSIFGFISLVAPWLSIVIDVPVVGVVSISLSLQPYTAFFFIELFENLVYAQLLMVFGSLLALLFLNKFEDGDNKEKFDKTPILGFIGAILNALAFFMFFFVLLDEGSQYDMNPASISIGFGINS